MTRSGSGETWAPYDLDVVAGVGDHGELAGPATSSRPRASFAPPVPPESATRCGYQSVSGRPVSLIPACDLLPDVDRDQQRRERLDQARRLELAAVDRAQAGDPADQFGDRALGLLRVAGDEDVLVELASSRSASFAALTVWSALTTVDPVGHHLLRLLGGRPLRDAEQPRRLARHRGGERDGRVDEDLALGWSAPLRFVRFSDWARKGTVSSTIGPRGAAARRSRAPRRSRRAAARGRAPRPPRRGRRRASRSRPAPRPRRAAARGRSRARRCRR